MFSELLCSVNDRSKPLCEGVLCRRIIYHHFVTFDRHWWLAAVCFVATLMSGLKCAKHLDTEGGDNGNVENRCYAKTAGAGVTQRQAGGGGARAEDQSGLMCHLFPWEP